MPISKAAKKAQRASVKRYKTNLEFKKSLKEALKKASAKNLNKVFSIIDKAVKKHLLHINKAARMKSALSKKFSASAPAKSTKTAPKKSAVKKPAKKSAVKKAK
jgi:small subunit ribosomal protein S20